VQHPGWNYEAQPYETHELPAPLPPRSDKLPWERKEAMEKERQEHNIAQTQKAYDEAARQKARGGIFNSMAAAVKPRWARLKTTPRPVSEAVPTKRDERRFNNKFHFPAYERLLYASELCKTVSGPQQILGKIYVSENFLCFRESRLQPKGGRRQRLLLVIPIDEVLSLAQAEIVSHPDPRYAPEFRVLDQWHSKGDGIFLFTRDEKVHRFFGFWTQQTFHDTFNVLDRQWRSRFGNISDAPLRRGESASSRTTLPVSAARSPSYVITEPAAKPHRASTGPDYVPVRSSGTQWANQSVSKTHRPRLPHSLSMDLKHSPITRLRHIAEASPRYNHVLFTSGDTTELIELDSAGVGVSGGRSSQKFGLSSQGRQFRTRQYQPQQHRFSEQTSNREIREERDWQSRKGYQGYQQSEPRWSKKDQVGRRVAPDLADEIKRADMRRLHHVEQPGYVPSGVKLGRVVDSVRPAYWSATRTDAKRWSQPQQQQQQERSIGSLQRDRLGFQTVQKRLQAQQRGRVIDPQLKSEICQFNRRSLNHVKPIVRVWTPTAADIKEHKKRHRHHHHHKFPRRAGEELSDSSMQRDEPVLHVEVFESEEFDLVPTKNYVREQAKKLDEQVKQERQQPMQQRPDRWAVNGFEAGTA
jgi:hypothetical protein